MIRPQPGLGPFGLGRPGALRGKEVRELSGFGEWRVLGQGADVDDGLHFLAVGEAFKEIEVDFTF